jgi:hypothetical protein
LADALGVTATPGYGEPAWTDWNRDMDQLWAMRLGSRGASAAYLPPELQSEAYALDAHGRWEMVPYNGSHYRLWRPVQVGIGWSPFTFGAWMVWHGDHVWVPTEPFGYVTHHYGNWIYTAGAWYWAPPVTRIMIQARLPLLTIGFGWYPGRVGWIYSGVHIGWIPWPPTSPTTPISAGAGAALSYPPAGAFAVLSITTDTIGTRWSSIVTIFTVPGTTGRSGSIRGTTAPWQNPFGQLLSPIAIQTRETICSPGGTGSNRSTRTQASRRGEITWNRANRRLFAPPGSGGGSLKFRRDETRPESRGGNPGLSTAPQRRSDRSGGRTDGNRSRHKNQQLGSPPHGSPNGRQDKGQSTHKVYGRSIGEQSRRHRFNVQQPTAERPSPRVIQRQGGQWYGAPKSHDRSISTQNRRSSGRHYRTGPRGSASAPSQNRAWVFTEGKGASAEYGSARVGRPSKNCYWQAPVFLENGTLFRKNFSHFVTLLIQLGLNPLVSLAVNLCMVLALDSTQKDSFD